MDGEANGLCENYKVDTQQFLGKPMHHHHALESSTDAIRETSLITLT